MPAISVIIPTYNRQARLEKVLAALAQQTVAVDDMEVIVVSDGSTDGTDDALGEGRTPMPVTFLPQENQGVAVARNNGVGAATAELILFIDDDVVPEPECVAVHLDAHAGTTEPTVIVGPLLTPTDLDLEPWVDWEQTMLYKQYHAMARGEWEPSARQFYTGNASLPRATFRAAGGFDPSFRRGEDVELAYRLNDAGIPFRFEFRARAFHHASRTYESWLSNATSYGQNDVILWRDRGQQWLMPTVRAEYELRNPLTRRYTTLGLKRPRLGALVARRMPGLVRAAEQLGLDNVSRRGLSAVYNLAYYQGVVDELGGWDRFIEIESQLGRASREDSAR